ncbi:SMP-30/gluconolactonase/LRE family protein [Fimbriiglobus ruber]|uniref:SMP-30/Gluconolactonase/LRE-like region domain-containing protein n=1 Tax=Fimbriiglobus ruber TaxID=1908690 RepID=A0A225DX36_9BACT|nr:SMP-30/gluconolactonase/LRE family protein [Fimbriiglobus ruber]OWK41759.1 hypothetical protein FRUB_03837 [Fimbriiglobus ruber]
MNRFVCVAAILLLAAPAAVAQDMPLTMFLIDGEGWTKAPAVVTPPAAAKVTPPSVVAKPTVAALNPAGTTWYVGSAEGRYVWAFQADKDGQINPASGDRYARLWVHKGQKDQPVSGLTFDTRGCIYAATPAGIQAFDPTGRLCGVIALPAPGQTGELTWTGDARDHLTVRVGDTWYVRKLKATGPK